MSSFDHSSAAAQVAACLSYAGVSFSWTPRSGGPVTFAAAVEEGPVEDLSSAHVVGELNGYVLTASTVDFTGAYPEIGDTITDTAGRRYRVAESVGDRHPMGVVRIHTIAIS